LPPDLAYVVFTLEVLGGIALVLGVETRWAALAVVPVLAGATWAHLACRNLPILAVFHVPGLWLLNEMKKTLELIVKV